MRDDPVVAAVIAEERLAILLLTGIVGSYHGRLWFLEVAHKMRMKANPRWLTYEPL